MNIVGKTGRVVTPIGGNGNPGEVIISGMVMLAYSSRSLRQGENVIVIEDRGPNSVEVSAL
jgi:membrane-bound ClpP family serine protease